MSIFTGSKILFDPFINTYEDLVVDLGEGFDNTGDVIIINKPVHITFHENLDYREALIIDGEVDIKLDTRIRENLQVDGYITTTCLNTLSDISLKENIKPLDDVSLSDINVYKYNFKNNKETTHYGVIAQELITQPQFKHLVNKSKETLSVDYIQFIPVIIREIQKLKKNFKNLLKLLFLFNILKFFVKRVKNTNILYGIKL